MKRLLLLLAAAMMTSCASVRMLPQDAASVDFTSREGKTGWSKYEQVERFSGYRTDQIYEAAKVGLGSAGFALRRVDITKGMLIGEHGMTRHDWNIMAGVYFRESGGSHLVKVIAHGSKDIGFSGDVTADGWTGKILIGMREHLKSTR